jgi:putative transposase
MFDRPRKRMDHEVPIWVRPEADFFITACAERRGTNHFCDPVIGPAVIESITNRHVRGIWYYLAVLMPDHIHLLLNFPGDKSLSRIIGEWKGWLGRYWGIAWQRNFFDHRLRNEQQDRFKSDYVFNNPVRAGLVENPEDWPYTWMPKE